MKRFKIAALTLLGLLFAANSFATWTGTPVLVAEVVDRAGVTAMVDYSIELVSDGSAGTYTFPAGMMEKIRGLYFLGAKFDIPGTNPPEADFAFAVKDQDGFAWFNLSDADADADSARPGSETWGMTPPVASTKSGDTITGFWSLAIGDIGDANDTFTVHLIFGR